MNLKDTFYKHTQTGASFMQDSKPSNPKDAIGSDKLPLHLWPETATIMGCMGLLDGMLKYGRSNYRAVGVRASIYVDACKRHLNAWFEGEDTDPDSGLPHLAHALACLAILVDAQAADQLTDDRQISGGYRKMVEEMTPHVDRLRDLHKGRDPKHYTIKDRPKPAQGKDFIDEETRDKIIREAVRRDTTLLPIWQQPHTVHPKWDFYSYSLGGEVMRCKTTQSHFSEDEIAEMCRLAKSGSVTLYMT